MTRTKLPHKCKYCNKQLYTNNRIYIVKSQTHFYLCKQCFMKGRKNE